MENMKELTIENKIIEELEDLLRISNKTNTCEKMDKENLNSILIKLADQISGGYNAEIELLEAVSKIELHETFCDSNILTLFLKFKLKEIRSSYFRGNDLGGKNFA